MRGQPPTLPVIELKKSVDAFDDMVVSSNRTSAAQEARS